MGNTVSLYVLIQGHDTKYWTKPLEDMFRSASTITRGAHIAERSPIPILDSRDDRSSTSTSLDFLP